MKDLGKAFTYPFKDPAWVSKLLLSAVFMILSLFVIGLFVMAGYFIQIVQNVMRGERERLPEWNDVGVKFLLGFKYCVVSLIYLLPVFLLLLPLLVLSLIGMVSEEPEFIGVLASIYSFGFILIVIPYSLALALFLPIITYRFAAHERIGEALDIGEMIRNFKRTWQDTLVIALIAIGLHAAAALGLIVFVVGVLFTLFYAYAVSSYLYGVLAVEAAHVEGAR